VKEQKIPTPLEKPRDLGKDRKGRDLGSYKPEEFRSYEKRERELGLLKVKSALFSERREDLRNNPKVAQSSITEGDIEEERNRRKLIGHLQGKAMGKYEGNPVWDDVVPIPQEDGEGALAAIAYTDEYAEGKSKSISWPRSHFADTNQQQWATSAPSWQRKNILRECWI